MNSSVAKNIFITLLDSPVAPGNDRGDGCPPNFKISHPLVAGFTLKGTSRNDIHAKAGSD
jgi:hypothetical protein